MLRRPFARPGLRDGYHWKKRHVSRPASHFFVASTPSVQSVACCGIWLARAGKSHSPQVIFLLLAIVLAHATKQGPIHADSDAFRQTRQRELAGKRLVAGLTIAFARPVLGQSLDIERASATPLQYEFQNLAIIHRFRTVRERQELTVNNVQFPSVHRESQFRAAQTKGMAAGMFA